MKVKVAIIAGGVGTRLWPVSRLHAPKQVSALFGDQSVLQRTYKILRKKFTVADILIVTGETFASTVIKQLKLPPRQVIVESCRRDTAAAIGLAAWQVASEDPETILITVHADHAIARPAEYVRTLLAAARMAAVQPETLITIGANPTYPETGYGYIRLGAENSRKGRDIFYHVSKFTEKPKLTTARKYIADRRYLWNTGIFVFQVGQLQRWYQQYLPSHYRIFETIFTTFVGQSARLTQAFPKLPAVSIDYGLLEKMSNLIVLPASFGWQDIGSWSVVAGLAKQSSSAKRLAIEAHNNFIISNPGKLVALVGLDNYLIIDTEDALLICPKDKSQMVKDIVKKIEQKKWLKYL